MNKIPTLESQNQGTGTGCPVINSSSFLKTTDITIIVNPTIIVNALNMNSRIEESDEDNPVIFNVIDLSNPPDDGSAIINNSTSWQ